MPTPSCFASLDLAMIRVARLNTVGSPVTGAGNGYISNAPIKMDVKLDLNKGEDFETQNGTGAICAAFHDCDRIKSLMISMDLCQLDLQLMELLTGATVLTSGGNPVGGQLPAVGSNCPSSVCVEAWTKAWDGGNPAIPTITSPNAAYIHWVFPKATFHMSDFTLQHGFTVFGVDGKGEENSRITANGPYDDWPSFVTNAGGITRVGGYFYDATLPTATCGYTSVSSAAS